MKAYKVMNERMKKLAKQQKTLNKTAPPNASLCTYEPLPYLAAFPPSNAPTGNYPRNNGNEHGSNPLNSNQLRNSICSPRPTLSLN